MCSEVAKFVEPSLGRKEYIDVAFERDSQTPSVKRCAGFWSKKGLNALKYNYCDYQGCISCGILVSGIGARGVSSEHMENMEMFSLSPT